MRWLIVIGCIGAAVACVGSLPPVPSPADHLTDADAGNDNAAAEDLCRRVCQVADQVVCEALDCVGPCVVRLQDPYCHSEAMAMFACLSHLQPSDYHCEGGHRMRATATCDDESRVWAQCLHDVQTGKRDAGGD